jgi:hypothetical protein
MPGRPHRRESEGMYEPPTVVRRSPIAMVEETAHAIARVPVMFDEADERLDSNALIGGLAANENHTVLMPSAPRLLATPPARHVIIPAPVPVRAPRRASIVELALISVTTFAVVTGTFAIIAFYLFG